jgi:23S rRNA (guanosine2251-2'-O)-methyltransferase
MKGRTSKQGYRKLEAGARQGKQRRDADHVRIYGLHAAEAALANPRREIRHIHATPNAAQRLAAVLRPGHPEITPVIPRDLDRMLSGDSVHQGVLVEAEALPDPGLAGLPEARLVLFLDQITDPHNVGAILRTAAAFGVDALVMTARNSPPLDGTLAKAASGGLEHVPVVLVPNLSRALVEAEELGFTRIGLDSDGEGLLDEAEAPERLALVLGAEDRGLRRLTREHCERVLALRTYGPIASLNVSNAAAIALQIMTQKMRQPSQSA